MVHSASGSAVSRIVLASTGMVRLPPREGGAVEDYVLDLNRMVRSTGVDATLVAPTRNGASFSGSDVVEVPTRFDSFPLSPTASALAHTLGGWATARAVRRWFDRHPPQGGTVLHLNEEVSATILTHSDLRVPKVFTLHNPPPLGLGAQLGRVDAGLRAVNAAITRRLICHRADRVIALNRYFADFLQQSWNVPAERIRLLPLPIDTTTFQPGASTHDHTEYLYVGRLDCRKNVMALVQAMTTVDNGGRLTLVGDGPLAGPIRSFVRAKSLDGKVRMLPRLPLDRLVETYQASDVFLFPSLLEAYGRAIVEAAACGLPVVLPDNRLFGDFVRGGFVMTVPDAGSRSLGNAMNELGNDWPRRRDMGGRARRFVLENNSYDSFRDRLLGLYRELC